MEIRQTSSTDDVHGELEGDKPQMLDYRSARSGKSNLKPIPDSLPIALMAVVLVGGLFGIPFMLISLVAAGAGHGSAFILELASAPLILTGSGIVVWFGTPVLWAIFAALASKAASRAGAVMFLLLVGLHYVVNLLSLRGALWEFGRAGSDIEWFGLVVYALGHATLWTIFIFARRSRVEPPEDPRYWVEEL